MPTHNPRKRFGQNFLQDKNIIYNIVSQMHLQSTDHVLEIGPGKGALTLVMLDQVARLDAIEIDRDLYQFLCTEYHDIPNFHVHQQDALKCQLNTFSQQQPVRVVGNLPYNISTPLLFHLLKQIEYIQDMHFMLQKEVVERMCAPVNSSDYGRLSVMVQYYCHAENLFTVPPTAFNPRPKVDSAIVRLTPNVQAKHQVTNLTFFGELVTAAFNQRRKTIRNGLKDFATIEQLEISGINPQWRPQQISVANFVKLANLIMSSS